MKKYKPSEEVDFVIIGSGAAGGVMAKQLAQAGFSVVVMEQGAWGAYGHEQDYNKDELINRFPSEEDVLISDPKKHRNTFRRNVNEKAVTGGHTYGCVVGGGTVTYGASSWRHLPYEFNEASTFHPIYSLGGSSASVALQSLRDKPLDAIVMLGTGMPTLRPIAESIGRTGPPAMSCNLCLAWRAVEALDGRAPGRAALEPWLSGEGWIARLNERQ